MKLLGQGLSACDFDRQIAGFQVRVTVLNGFIALGTLITEGVGWVCPEDGKDRSAADLCSGGPSQWKSVRTTNAIRFRTRFRILAGT